MGDRKRIVWLLNISTLPCDCQVTSLADHKAGLTGVALTNNLTHLVQWHTKQPLYCLSTKLFSLYGWQIWVVPLFTSHKTPKQVMKFVPLYSINILFSSPLAVNFDQTNLLLNLSQVLLPVAGHSLVSKSNKWLREQSKAHCGGSGLSHRNAIRCDWTWAHRTPGCAVAVLVTGCPGVWCRCLLTVLKFNYKNKG